MKKLLSSLITICILSFVGFGVSRLILGTTNRSSNNVPAGSKSIFSELVTSNDSWEIVNEFPNIIIHTAGATTVIEQNDGDRIQVKAEVPDGRKLYVGASYIESAEELTIEVRPENITFADIVEEFGKVLWSDDVFKFPEGVTVTISFPQTIYDSLSVKHGSGKLYVNELYANVTDVDIGSGTFEIQRSKDFTGDSFDISLGAGKAKVKNMRAHNYDIKIGLGSYDFTGISGSGSIEMGSGKGTLVLADDCESVDLNMGSGSLDIYIEDSGAEINADIGSGSVNIEAYGTNKKLKDDSDEDVVVGSGKTTIDIEMGSGSIDIFEAANAPELQLEIPETQKSADSLSSAETVNSSMPETASSSMPDSTTGVEPVVPVESAAA